MGEHHGTAHHVLRVDERGSAILEGTVGLAIAFLLLALFVQLGMLMTARAAAQAAVAASARRAAWLGTDLAAEEAALARILEATVPGAQLPEVAVTRRDRIAHAEVSFTWDPPGPRWIPLRVAVRSSSPVVIPP